MLETFFTWFGVGIVLALVLERLFPKLRGRRKPDRTLWWVGLALAVYVLLMWGEA